MLKNHRQRGDTLIEVLFAITIFSLVVVSALSIMNEGSSDAERSMEITLARQAMDAQAETLRFLNASYVANYHPGETLNSSTPAGQWAAMTASIQQTGRMTASSFGDSLSCPTAQQTDGSFVVDPATATFIPPTNSNILQPATTYPQLVYTSGSSPTLSSAQGLWIEAIRSATDNSDPDQTHIGFIDFHIYTCWDSPGQTVPVTLATIVRLYEPR